VIGLRPTLLLLALSALVAGCGGPTLEARGVNCWGAGGGDAAHCRDALSARLVGLALVDSAAQGVLGASTCGGLIDCATAVIPTPVASRTPTASHGGSTTPAATPAASTPRATTPEATTPAAGEPSTPRLALATPEPRTPEPVVTGGADSCAGYQVASLEAKSGLTPEETVCLQDTAHGRRTASDPDMQIAAVTLYNRRISGWPGAVEAALGRPSLGNAPALNFAGIKPAYDAGRYSTVMKRAKAVWRNLDKGYQLSSSDRSFVSEYACRSSAQLALSGKDPGDGITWCERWYDLAERAGKPTDPIQDLIDQLE
jgi:hypothetical protein